MRTALRAFFEKAQKYVLLGLHFQPEKGLFSSAIEKRRNAYFLALFSCGKFIPEKSWKSVPLCGYFEPEKSWKSVPLLREIYTWKSRGSQYQFPVIFNLKSRRNQYCFPVILNEKNRRNQYSIPFLYYLEGLGQPSDLWCYANTGLKLFLNN
jgi:hypothetical protein